MLAELHKDIIW